MAPAITRSRRRKVPRRMIRSRGRIVPCPLLPAGHKRDTCATIFSLVFDFLGVSYRIRTGVSAVREGDVVVSRPNAKQAAGEFVTRSRTPGLPPASGVNEGGANLNRGAPPAFGIAPQIWPTPVWPRCQLSRTARLHRLIPPCCRRQTAIARSRTDGWKIHSMLSKRYGLLTISRRVLPWYTEASFAAMTSTCQFIASTVSG